MYGHWQSWARLGPDVIYCHWHIYGSKCASIALVLAQFPILCDIVLILVFNLFQVEPDQAWTPKCAVSDSCIGLKYQVVGMDGWLGIDRLSGWWYHHIWLYGWLVGWLVSWMVGWLGGKGAGSQIRWNDDSVWLCGLCWTLWSLSAPFMPHWQLHSQGAQSFDLCLQLSPCVRGMIENSWQFAKAYKKCVK